VAVDAYTLEQAEEDIAELRGDASQKEENLTITGQLTATGGTAAGPTLITTDTWHDTGAMKSSWGKGTGYFKYKLLADGNVQIAAKGLTTGTVVDFTEILSAANGLPAGYQPTTSKHFPCYTDNIKAGSATFEVAALLFAADGSVQCLGFNTSATVAHCYAIMPIDI
jgi:hypothetical protein